ncbi:MAG: response regulator transcription factor [Bryobacteraceae bacterium]|jgi:DNA-binding NarL/FixJ family response regulator
MNRIRILVADDHELVRKGLISVLLRAHPEWEIVGEAENGQQAIRMAEELRPDVAIVDLTMPEPNGLKVTESLVSSIRAIKVLVLTVHAAEPVKRLVRRAGAGAFLAKNEVPSSLVVAVERMLAGEPFFASNSASRPVSQLAPKERVPVQYLLTPRELDVLRMLVQGLSSKEIAPALEMSVRTVESHRANIMSRLAIESLGDLIRMALADGLG